MKRGLMLLTLLASAPTVLRAQTEAVTAVATDTAAPPRAEESAAVRYRAMAIGIVSSSVWTQALGVPEGWDRTWQGFGNRVGDQVGFAASEELLRLGLERGLHWTALRPECAGARGPRPWRTRAGVAARCAMTRTFVAQNRAGAHRPNVPLLGAIVAASALSLTWRPERTSAAKGQAFMLTRVGIVTGATVLNRAMKEMRGR